MEIFLPFILKYLTHKWALIILLILFFYTVLHKKDHDIFTIQNKNEHDLLNTKLEKIQNNVGEIKEKIDTFYYKFLSEDDKEKQKIIDYIVQAAKTSVANFSLSVKKYLLENQGKEFVKYENDLTKIFLDNRIKTYNELIQEGMSPEILEAMKNASEICLPQGLDKLRKILEVHCSNGTFKPEIKQSLIDSLLAELEIRFNMLWEKSFRNFLK